MVTSVDAVTMELKVAQILLLDIVVIVYTLYMKVVRNDIKDNASVLIITGTKHILAWSRFHSTKYNDLP